MRYKTIAVSFFADEAAKWKEALGEADFEPKQQNSHGTREAKSKLGSEEFAAVAPHLSRLHLRKSVCKCVCV